MFSKLAIVSSLALLAVATPTGPAPAPPAPPVSQCNTGALNCCQTVENADSPAAQSVIAGLLGVILGPITGQVGLTCSPLSVIGIGGNSCTAQTACCTGNTFNGLITIGCSPINLGL